MRFVRAEAKRFGQWRDLLHAEPVLNEIRRVAEQPVEASSNGRTSAMDH
jgi:hypothetical protein